MNADRLSELQTLDPQDAPDDARIAITACDLRDLVALVPVAAAAIAECSREDRTYEQANELSLATENAVDALRERSSP